MLRSVFILFPHTLHGVLRSSPRILPAILTCLPPCSVLRRLARRVWKNEEWWVYSVRVCHDQDHSLSGRREEQCHVFAAVFCFVLELLCYVLVPMTPQRQRAVGSEQQNFLPARRFVLSHLEDVGLFLPHAP